MQKSQAIECARLHNIDRERQASSVPGSSKLSDFILELFEGGSFFGKTHSVESCCLFLEEGKDGVFCFGL